jgi:hypothetical protein
MSVTRDVGRREIELTSDGFLYEPVEVSELVPGQFLLHWSALWMEEPAFLGDVIEAEPDEKGGYRFRRVVERSGMRTMDWLLPREVTESAELAELCDAIERHGGLWERVTGGCLFIHLPPDSVFDAEKELERVLERVRASGAEEAEQGGQSGT